MRDGRVNPMSQRHGLYFFGRTSLWIFLILFIEGLFLPRLIANDASLSKSIANQAPPFIRYYIWFIGAILPWFAFPGVIASLALMRQQNWARIVLAGLFGLGAIGAIVFGIFFERWAYDSTPSLWVVVEAALIVGGMAWFLVVCARKVMSRPFMG